MATVVTLSGVIDKKLKIIKNEAAAFGFFVKVGKDLYDFDLTLHKVHFDEGMLYSVDEDCYTGDTAIFPNIQGHVLETN